jgi:hypothetical protein
LLGEDSRKRIEPLEKLVTRHGWLAVVAAAATPLPDDIIFLLLAISNYSSKLFIPTVFAAKTHHHNSRRILLTLLVRPYMLHHRMHSRRSQHNAHNRRRSNHSSRTPRGSLHTNTPRLDQTTKQIRHKNLKIRKTSLPSTIDIKELLYYITFRPLNLLFKPQKCT